MDTKNKCNPKLDYNATNITESINKNLKFAINENITSNNNSYQILIYDKNNYRIYNLVITDLPILNVIIKDSRNNTIVDIELFDNNINSTQKLIKSFGKLKYLKDEYELTLIKETLGHNIRDNNISLFGYEKENHYILKRSDSDIENKKLVNLFINNKYIGKFTLELLKERK